VANTIERNEEFGLQVDEIALGIQAGMASLERTFVARADMVAANRRRHDRLLDQIERELEDVSDEAARKRLVRDLGDLESSYVDVIQSLHGLVTYEMFDPFRILAADIVGEGVG
jgi:hypothetical protein